MAMGPERSRPLHNFTLPCELKWGNRKFLPCVKLDSNGGIASVLRRPNGLSEWGRAAPGRPKRETVVTSRKIRSCVDAGIASVREKLMFDLQTAADQMKDTIFREGLKEEEEEKTAAADPNKPWSSRTRQTTVGSTQNVSPSRGGENASPALPVGEKRQRVKLSVPLARPEIEEDFMVMVGHRPARRPKKRSKFVQKNLDTLFPGLWLKEITADLYKVSDDQ